MATKENIIFLLNVKYIEKKIFEEERNIIPIAPIKPNKQNGRLN